MNSNSDNVSPADRSCEECGQFGVLEIAGRLLCSDCVAVAGCGCAGHGEDDEE